MRFPRSIVAAIAFLSLGGFACTPAASPTATTLTSARTATVVAMDAWNLAAEACNDAAVTAGGDSGVAIESSCSTYLVPAHDLIAQAAQDVDNAADGGLNNTQIACNLLQASTYLTQAAQDPALKLPASAAAVLNDANVVAKAVLGSAICADAG